MDAWLMNLAGAAWAQCWQVTALALAVWVIVRLMGRSRPHLASVLWLVVLLKCLTPPIVSSPTGVFCWLRQAQADSGPATSPQAAYWTAADGPVEEPALPESHAATQGDVVVRFSPAPIASSNRPADAPQREATAGPGPSSSCWPVRLSGSVVA